MKENVSVIVATFGSSEWEDRGNATARQLSTNLKPAPLEVVGVHLSDGSLAQARNAAAAQARGTFLVFCDADDMLHHSYVDGVLNGWGKLRQPKTTYSSPDGQQHSAPAFIPPAPGGDLRKGNWLVIGTAVRRAMFEEVGGFDEYEAWEDWALWLKCFRAGAQIGKAPRAIYHIGPIKPGDRNQQTIGNKTLFDKIVKECGE